MINFHQVGQFRFRVSHIRYRVVALKLTQHKNDWLFVESKEVSPELRNKTLSCQKNLSTEKSLRHFLSNKPRELPSYTKCFLNIVQEARERQRILWKSGDKGCISCNKLIQNSEIGYRRRSLLNWPLKIYLVFQTLYSDCEVNRKQRELVGED